jgi:hypothetical protein
LIDKTRNKTRNSLPCPQNSSIEHYPTPIESITLLLVLLSSSSSSYGSTAQFWPRSPLFGFHNNNLFYRTGLLVQRPTPNLGIVPCSLVEVYRRFRGAYSIIRARRQCAPLKRRSASTRLHGTVSQKAVIKNFRDLFQFPPQILSQFFTPRQFQFTSFTSCRSHVSHWVQLFEITVYCTLGAGLAQAV